MHRCYSFYHRIRIQAHHSVRHYGNKWGSLQHRLITVYYYYLILSLSGCSGCVLYLERGEYSAGASFFLCSKGLWTALMKAYSKSCLLICCAQEAAKAHGRTSFKPNTLVSDDDTSSWKAAKEVFPEIKDHFLCTWHVDKNWKKNIREKCKVTPIIRLYLHLS